MRQLLSSEKDKEAILEKYQEDRMLLLKDTPFYGMLLLYFTAVSTDNCIAAISANKKIYLGNSDSPKPYLSLTALGRKTLLVHEILHVALDHLCMPGNLNRDIANIAQDAVINRIISSDQSLSLAALPDGIVTPLGYGGSYTGFTLGGERFTIPNFMDLDWVGIYKILMSSLEDKAKQKGQSLEKAIKDLVSKAGGLHGDSLMQDAEQLTPEESQQIQQIRQATISAYEGCKNQGDVPAEIERLINKIGEAEVPWTRELLNLIRSHIAQDDFSWKYSSRRAHLGFFPRVESEAIGDVWLALDTSGSMAQAELAKGLAEFRSIRQTCAMGLHFICCDATTYTLQSYERHEEPEWEKVKIQGGGGTSFVPVFNLIQQKRDEGFEKPCLLVFFTDTYGTFPAEAPDYPVIWVTIGGNEVPWGKQIEVKV